MKKNYSFILFAILFISNAFGLITDLISPTKVTNNFNKTGVILYNEYESDLEIGSNIIKTYSYIDLTSKDSPKIDTNNLELNNSLENLEPNSISILIPRKIEHTKEISIKAYEDVLLRMYNTVNLQNTKLNLQPTSEPFLNAIESYLVANTLENSLDAQKKAKLAGAILGSHALFMPQNKSTINKFNGVGRVLSTPITYINDILLEKNDFTNNQTITEEQIASLQNLIFQEMQKAKTVVFIPECMSNKLSDNQASRSIRLPLAIINKIDLNLEDNTINIEFLTSKTAENNFGGYYNFLNARQSLFQHEANTDNQWEFINYTFKIGFNNTNTFNKCYKNPSIYYYQVSNINIEPNGIVNTQQLNDTTNNRPPQDRLTSTEYLLNSNSDSNSDSTNINSYNDLQEQNRLSQATLPSAEDLQNMDSSYEQEIKDYYKTNGSPCNHYKRKCLVKIEDDDKFYPCHRCYNNKKVITDRNLLKKAKNVTELKCLECGHEQPFDPATGSNCLNCDTKFAVYYCGSCKHLTGMDDHPYHCEKCNICRIHVDRSFHCDICGVCLDVQLKNNHKCRAGSEHDECFICFEDAFTGCKILPCSHKVHKECSVKMIRSGITRCPICRESFAHKLERRPLYSIYDHQVSNINIEPNGIVNTQQLNDTTNNRPPQDRLTSTEDLLNSDSDSTNINSYNDLQEQNRLSQATLPSAENLQNMDSSYEQAIKDYYKTNGSPCNHYKRKCLVKIEDDDKFYPCHRCYNKKKVITDRKLLKKSKNATALKCLECGHEQPFDPATGSNCLNCDTKFAVYYCGSCKHLTGMDDHPYHCEKCNICRIHGDRSFHCDICGVCLDVQLKNNHKCRAGSEHDECFICFEDAFTGCQILPCSHKVHKECSVQMIRSGITRCPICRESFAHKLERRPLYR